MSCKWGFGGGSIKRVGLAAPMPKNNIYYLKCHITGALYPGTFQLVVVCTILNNRGCDIIDMATTEFGIGQMANNFFEEHQQYFCRLKVATTVAMEEDILCHKS